MDGRYTPGEDVLSGGPGIPAPHPRAGGAVTGAEISGVLDLGEDSDWIAEEAPGEPKPGRRWLWQIAAPEPLALLALLLALAPVFAQETLGKLALVAAGSKPSTPAEGMEAGDSVASQYAGVCAVLAILAVTAGLVALRRNGDGPRWVAALAGSGVVCAVLVAAVQVASVLAGHGVYVYLWG